MLGCGQLIDLKPGTGYALLIRVLGKIPYILQARNSLII